MPEAVPGVWVFMGVRATHPAAVFSTLENGEAWVRRHQLEGMLSWYPLDMSAYDWAVDLGHFKPKPHQHTQQFLAGFTSASQPHHHYEFAEVSETTNEG